MAKDKIKTSVEKPKYWYLTEVEYCVLCGRERKSRERVYDKEKSGTVFTEFACGNHFM